MMENNENDFVKIIKAAETVEKFELFADDKTRAVVLIVEDFFDTKDEEFYKTLESFPVPIILALKNSADEKFIAACHLCIAAETAKVGKFSADEALKKGLINKIAPFDKVEAEALALAEKISQMAPLAVRACLKAVTEGARLSLTEGLKIETNLFAKIFSTADMREGTRAFLEKRRPNFQGK